MNLGGFKTILKRRYFLDDTFLHSIIFVSYCKNTVDPQRKSKIVCKIITYLIVGYLPNTRFIFSEILKLEKS